MATPVSIFLIPIVLLVTSWGFGSLMRTIGILSGWNPKRTFWISCIVYAIVLILVFLSSTGYITFLYVYIGVGLLSPLINITIKWLNPDAFTKPSPNTNTNLKSQGVVKEEPTPQKPRSSSPHDGIQHKPEIAKSPIAAKNIKPNTDTRLGRVFVSYRRSDSADISGRIYDRLIGRFGKEPIFKDVDSIPLGVDFKEYLGKKVGECDVLLAIIGDRWLDASDSTGKIRLEDPTDFVRIEIQSALERDIPVIPLLVRGALVPREESLPLSLRKLVYRNGIPIRSDPDFHRDMDRLISALEKYILRE